MGMRPKQKLKRESKNLFFGTGVGAGMVKVNNVRDRLLEKHAAVNLIRYRSKKCKRVERELRMISLMPGQGISRALDIGCGDFPLIESLPCKAEKFAVDLVQRKIKNVKVKVHNVEDGVPFESGYFDFVIAGEIIEHLYDTEQFLKECNRVLRKDGVLLLSTPNTGSLHNILNAFLGRQPDWVEYDIGGSGHIRNYAYASLMKQLKLRGFRVEKFTSDKVYLPFYFYIKPIRWLCGKLALAMPRFGDSLIVKARKVGK